MSRIAILRAAACAAALITSLVPPLAAQVPQPVTAPVREAKIRFDPGSGTFVRVPVGGADSFGLGTVYDNTCPTGAYLPLQSQFMTGGAEAVAAGDWGAIPGDLYPGDGACVTGCQAAYEVSQFQIAYCTTTAIPPRAVVRFWDVPQSSCTMGGTVIGGTTPPTTPEAFSVTLTGLPRAELPGILACYQLTVDLGTPGFVLGGATAIMPGAVDGDRFAWSVQFPSTDGTEGPLIAGMNGQPPCRFCSGTIWEVGNQSPAPGTGFGQDDHLFVDRYGAPTPSSDCVQFPGVWSGLHLELQSPEVCQFATAGTDSFCDATDGSLAFCPCANPGNMNSGCDNAQGTGGVSLQVVDQDQTLNRVTMIGVGYPAMSQPAAVAIRSPRLDPNTPIVFGDGLRCISTTALVRLGATLATGGVSSHTFGHSPSMAGPGFFYYQLWYRNTPITFCLAPPGTLGYNLSNGQRLYWMQ